MATRLYKISVGEGDAAGGAVSEGVGSAVVSDTVELTVELATTAVNTTNSTGTATTRGIYKYEVIEALQKLINYITKSNWPPA